MKFYNLSLYLLALWVQLNLYFKGAKTFQISRIKNNKYVYRLESYSFITHHPYIQIGSTANNSSTEPFHLFEDNQILEGRFNKQLTQKPLIKHTENFSEIDNEEEEWNSIASQNLDNIEIDPNFDPVKFWQSEIAKSASLNSTDDSLKCFSDNEIDKMNENELKDALRIRGYRTDGNTFLLNLRLKDVCKKSLNNITPNESVQSEEKNKLLNEKVTAANKLISYISTSPKNDISFHEMKKRWDTRIEINEILDNPVKYFEIDSQQDANLLSEEKLKKVLKSEEDTNEDYEEILKEEIVDQIPKSFEIDELPEPENKIIRSSSENSIENLKKQYLSGYDSSLINDTIEEFSRRFDVSIDFLGDVLCKGGAIYPLNTESQLKDIVSLDVIWDLIELISVSDPIEINEYYLTDSISEIIDEYKINFEEITSICDSLNFKLPYGNKTRLNQDCFNALLSIIHKNQK